MFVEWLVRQSWAFIGQQRYRSVGWVRILLIDNVALGMTTPCLYV